GSASRRRTLPPGTSARRRDLASWANSRSNSSRERSNLRGDENRRDKKMGCSTSTPKVKAEKLPLLRGLFLSALGSLLRHWFFSSGCCDSASDEPLGRHYGWAEPSTLIPDVDYG